MADPIRAPNIGSGSNLYEFLGLELVGTKKSLKRFKRDEVLGALDSFADSFQAGGGVIFTTRAQANANLAYDANRMAWVILDPVPANNGVYQKAGASGVGAWARLANLPYSFYRAINEGLGSANAIVATNAYPLASTQSLIVVNVTNQNTDSPVTLVLNGAAPLTIKTSGGADIPDNGLQPGMVIAGYIEGDNFRLLSDFASAAVQAAVAADKVASEAARNIALQAADTAQTLGAGDVPTYPTRAVASALTLAIGRSYVILQGYTTVGDGGGGVYKRVATQPAHAGKFRSVDRYLPNTSVDAANGGWWELQEAMPHPRQFGAVSDGSTDAAASIAGCLGYASAKGIGAFMLPGDDFFTATGLTVPANVTFDGRGGRIKNTTSGIKIVSLSSGSKAVRLKLQGQGTSGSTVVDYDACLIASQGSYNGAGVAPTYVVNVEVRDCELNAAKGHGVMLDAVSGFVLKDNRGTDFGYSAVQTTSCRDGLVNGNQFKTVGPGISNTCYGMAFTRRTDVGYLTDLVRAPQSRDILVSNNKIEDNTIWEAFDTHGGIGIWFVGNQVKNCALGIVMTHDSRYAPQNCGAHDNHLVGRYLSSGSIPANGIVAVGNTATPDNAYALSVQNNYIEGFGNDNLNETAGIYGYGCVGLKITGNTIRKCYRAGIVLYAETDDFDISGNAIIDIGGSTDTSPTGIEIVSNNNSGYIGRNRVVRKDTTWATYVNVNGITIAGSSSNVISFSRNDIEVTGGTRYSVGGATILDYPTKFNGRYSAAAVSTAASADVKTIAFPGTFETIVGAIAGPDIAAIGSKVVIMAVTARGASTLETTLRTADASNFPSATAYSISWQAWGF